MYNKNPKYSPLTFENLNIYQLKNSVKIKGKIIIYPKKLKNVKFIIFPP